MPASRVPEGWLGDLGGPGANGGNGPVYRGGDKGGNGPLPEWFKGINKKGISKAEARHIRRWAQKQTPGDGGVPKWLRNIADGDKIDKQERARLRKWAKNHQDNGGSDDPNLPPWTDDDKDAFQMLKDMFGSYGLPMSKELRDIIKTGVLEGWSADMIQVQLQETKTWKDRFRGNEILRNSGGNVLSVQEYLAVENSYRQIMQAAGLPPGFYDDADDLAKFIGNSIAPAELQSRVEMASDLVRRDDPDVLAELRRRGLGQGDIIAYYLDPKRAAPAITKRYQSTLIGAAARRAGLRTATNYATKLAELGITEQQAAQGYGTVGDMLPTLDALGDIYGEDYSQRDAESEVFESNADAAAKRKRLSSRERAEFGGSSGFGYTSQRDTSGAF